MLARASLRYKGLNKGKAGPEEMLAKKLVSGAKLSNPDVLKAVAISKQQQGRMALAEQLLSLPQHRVLELPEEVFLQLVDLSNAVLRESNNQRDFAVAALFFEVSALYRCGAHSLRDEIRDHELWQSLAFWQFALLEWALGSDQERVPPHQVVKEHLRNFALAMGAMRVPVSFFEHLVERANARFKYGIIPTQLGEPLLTVVQLVQLLDRAAFCAGAVPPADGEVVDSKAPGGVGEAPVEASGGPAEAPFSLRFSLFQRLGHLAEMSEALAAGDATPNATAAGKQCLLCPEVLKAKPFSRWLLLGGSEQQAAAIPSALCEQCFRISLQLVEAASPAPLWCIGVAALPGHRKRRMRARGPALHKQGVVHTTKNEVFEVVGRFGSDGATSTEIVRAVTTLKLQQARTAAYLPPSAGIGAAKRAHTKDEWRHQQAQDITLGGRRAALCSFFSRAQHEQFEQLERAVLNLLTSHSSKKMMRPLHRAARVNGDGAVELLYVQTKLLKPSPVLLSDCRAWLPRECRCMTELERLSAPPSALPPSSLGHRLSSKRAREAAEQLISAEMYKLVTSEIASDRVIEGGGVIRTYEMFKNMRAELGRSFPQYLVPQLPPKVTDHESVGGAAQELRCKALERCINRLHAHPELCQAEVFEDFLMPDKDRGGAGSAYASAGGDGGAEVAGMMSADEAGGDAMPEEHLQLPTPSSRSKMYQLFRGSRATQLYSANETVNARMQRCLDPRKTERVRQVAKRLRALHEYQREHAEAQRNLGKALRSMAQWHATQSAGDCSRLAKFMSRIEVRNGVEVLPVTAMVAPVAPGGTAAAATVADPATDAVEDDPMGVQAMDLLADSLLSSQKEELHTVKVGKTSGSVSQIVLDSAAVDLSLDLVDRRMEFKSWLDTQNRVMEDARRERTWLDSQAKKPGRNSDDHSARSHSDLRLDEEQNAKVDALLRTVQVMDYGVEVEVGQLDLIERVGLQELTLNVCRAEALRARRQARIWQKNLCPVLARLAADTFIPFGKLGRSQGLVVRPLHRDIKFEDLHFLRTLGKGSFGEVKAAKYHGLDVAVKSCGNFGSMNADTRAVAESELRLMKQLPPHPNIVR